MKKSFADPSSHLITCYFAIMILIKQQKCPRSGFTWAARKKAFRCACVAPHTRDPMRLRYPAYKPHSDALPRIPIQQPSERQLRPFFQKKVPVGRPKGPTRNEFTQYSGEKLSRGHLWQINKTRAVIISLIKRQERRTFLQTWRNVSEISKIIHFRSVNASGCTS